MSNFVADLKRGKEGEEAFLALSAGKYERLDGREGDFIEVATGRKVELKTDFYDLVKTENFFFERYRNATTMKPGGPWQALEHGCELFIYFFIKNACILRFDCATLVKRLESMEAKLKPTAVINRGYVTIGYKVRRTEVLDLVLKETNHVQVQLPQ